MATIRTVVLCGFLLVPLSGCGGGGGSADVLQPDITFTPAEITAPQTTRLELIIRNTASNKNIENVHVEYFFPPGIQIERGSVGTLCGTVTGGNTTANGYEITAYVVPADTECGVFMTISSTPGDKTFEVPAGSATGNGYSNEDPVFATLVVH